MDGAAVRGAGGGRERDDVEGLLIGVAVRSLRLGADVVLDFGVWSRDERTCLRHLAADVGAASRLHYLPAEPEEQWRRLAARDDPGSFRIARAEMDGYATLFETPSAEELAGTDDRPTTRTGPSGPVDGGIRWPSEAGTATDAQLPAVHRDRGDRRVPRGGDLLAGR